MDPSFMKRLRTMDTVAFWISVAAGLAAAIAGALGLVVMSVISGCVAAGTPVLTRAINRREQQQLTDRLASQANILAQLADRTLTHSQAAKLIAVLQEGDPFDVWICFNRHEVEPSRFREELVNAFQAAGFNPKYFGGMTNSTVGVEVAGDETEEKRRLMRALTAAGIPHLGVHFADDVEGRWSPSIWVGIKPSPTM